jgi:FkbM family methyltransferase
MMISPKALSTLGVSPHGVLHVGAHEAEEGPLYAAQGWGPVTWVEMLPEKAAALRERFHDDPQNSVVEAACWSGEKTITIHRAINGQSSSVLEPKLHLTVHPQVKFLPATETIVTKRLDQVLPAHATFDFINVDTQGSELEIIKGLGQRLLQVNWAYVEVNEVEHYTGCALLPEVDAYLGEKGFVRALRLKADSAGWGDALYVRRNHPSARTLRVSSRIYHAYKSLRRPSHTPPWDNWR